MLVLNLRPLSEFTGDWTLIHRWPTHVNDQTQMLTDNLETSRWGTLTHDTILYFLQSTNVKSSAWTSYLSIILFSTCLSTCVEMTSTWSIVLYNVHFKNITWKLIIYKIIDIYWLTCMMANVACTSDCVYNNQT